MLRKTAVTIRNRMKGLWCWRNYYLSKVFKPTVPVRPLSELPNGFRVTHIGQTGVSAIDNFCTPQEAQTAIDLATKQLQPDSEGIERAEFENPASNAPHLNSLIIRCSMLTGLPATNIDKLRITRYVSGQAAAPHLDWNETNKRDRLYTVLVYLNDLPDGAGGETVFPDLNVSFQPRIGRAVSWINQNKDGAARSETRHAALPVKSDSEKWILQFWFRAGDGERSAPAPGPANHPVGNPLSKETPVIPGLACTAETTEEQVFDSMLNGTNPFDFHTRDEK